MRQNVGISAVGFNDLSEFLEIAEWAIDLSHGGGFYAEETIHLRLLSLKKQRIQVVISDATKKINIDIVRPAPEGVEATQWLRNLRSFLNCLFVVSGNWRVSSSTGHERDSLTVSYTRIRRK